MTLAASTGFSDPRSPLVGQPRLGFRQTIFNVPLADVDAVIAAAAATKRAYRTSFSHTSLGASYRRPRARGPGLTGELAELEATLADYGS